MHLGTIAAAKAAVRGTLRLLDYGSTRHAYVDDEERFVYKVARRPERDGTNIAEHLIFEAMRCTEWAKHAPPTRLIEVMHRIVLVMPYYADVVTNHDAADKLDKKLYKSGVMHDNGYFNMRLDKRGTIKVIDGGEWGWDSPVDMMIQVGQEGKCQQW